MELSDWVDSLAASGRLAEAEEPPEGQTDALDVVREILGPVSEQAGAVWGDRAGHLPLVLTKGLSARMLQCEAHALDDSRSERETWAQQRGTLLDLLVAIAASQRLDSLVPTGRPLDSDVLRTGLSEALVAGGRGRQADTLERLDDSQLDELWELALRAAGVEVDPSWSPRTEVNHRVAVGDSVELSGRMDLVLGGPGTGVRGICVEVKSGNPHPTHRGELHFYSLLWTLRTGAEPAALALWYPGSGVAEVPVKGAAIAGAKQAASALGRLVDFGLGEVPARRSGPQCGWCGLLAGCAVGSEWLDSRAGETDVEIL